MQASALYVAVVIATTSFSISGALPTAEGAERYFSLDGAAQIISILFSAGYSIGHIVIGIYAKLWSTRSLLICAAMGFAVFSFAGAVADDLTVFLVSRFMQGFFASTFPIVGRSLAWHQKGVEASASRLSAASAICTWMPVAAPLITAFGISIYGWQSAYYLFAFYGVAIAIATCFLRLESAASPVAAQERRSILARVRWLWGSRSFRAGLICTAMFFSGFFALLSSSSELITGSLQAYGVQPYHATTIIAASYALGGAGSYLLLKLWSSARLLRMVGIALVIVAILGVGQSLHESLSGFVLPLAALYSLLVGIALPNSMILAIRDVVDEKILALALVGSLKMLVSACCVSLVLITPFDYLASLMLLAGVIAVTGYFSQRACRSEGDASYSSA